MKKRVLRIDGSPLNECRWVLTLECGHEEWITSKARPKRKRAECGACDRPQPDEFTRRWATEKE